MQEHENPVPVPLAGNRRPPPALSRAAIEARADEKREKILRFLASEGYTVRGIAAQLLGVTANRAGASLRQLVASGELVSETVQIKGRDVVVYGLSSAGAALSPDPRTKPHSLGRIDPSRVTHRIEGQLARIKGEAAGWTGWLGERDLLAAANADKQAGNVWRKVPDALATRPDGRKVAVEIERNVKSPKRYAELIVAYILEMKDGRYDVVHFVAPDRGRAESVLRSMRKVDYLMVAGERVKFEEKHIARFRFFEHANWPDGPEVSRG